MLAGGDSNVGAAAECIARLQGMPAEEAGAGAGDCCDGSA
jgi:hypothetical protein